MNQNIKTEDAFKQIRDLVGPITEEQLRYVDCFATKNIGLFTPLGGACLYALAPLHSHPSYMFIISFNDETQFKIYGKTITSVSGKMFCLSPDIPHYELPSEFPPRYIAIFINKFFFKRQLAMYTVKQNIKFIGEFYPVNQSLLPLLRKFMIEFDNKIEGSEIILHAMNLEICHSIIRSIFDFTPELDKISNRLEIDKAIEYLYQNLDKKITVDNLAKAACMSPSHFFRVFKNEIGQPPQDYLNKVRMKIVKNLLKASDKPITEIALDCGFGSSSYLSACFRKAFNITPSDYQKAFKKDSISKKDKRKTKDKIPQLF
ncbi:helix-turn-helix transcriptional regulator [Candidatus Desantisbacteria bacterium]|nr:helix-turn-helix transcriptional regulator [Candidatus Desantisbacteria bacterium]